MDVAYDHIQEEALTAEEAQARAQGQESSSSLNSEFQEAFKAVSSSPWGARLGGFFGQVKKQGETLYSDAAKEYNAASEQASRGLTDILNRAPRVSLSQTAPGKPSPSPSKPTTTLHEDGSGSQPEEAGLASHAEQDAGPQATQRPDSLPADIVKEATNLVSRFRSEAAKRLKDVQQAEDAADEALLTFGTNIRNFLRDAVTVTAPDDEGRAGQQRGADDVLFETSDAEGKRVFHTSRFDAQLHVVHTTPGSFVRDPESEAYAAFAEAFDAGAKTDAIARDLERYEELRRAMERLVPEKVEYALFWTRYYFLRSAVEEEERRRKEVLKGAAAETHEEVGWGDEDEDEDDEDRATTPQASSDAQSNKTLHAPPVDKDLLKPSSPRRSHEDDGKSQAGSDASYDIISGATSRAPGSPKEEKKLETSAVKEESDEEDWE